MARAPASTTPRAPAGSITSPATPRIRSPSKLGVSRQTAQRLVSLAMSERLIKVRLDHPIARCMELAALLQPALRSALLRGRAERSGLALGDARHRADRRRRDGALAAPRRSGHHRHRHRAARCAPSPTRCRRWNARSTSWSALVGTTKIDGSASFYDVIIRLSDTVRAPHYPMPLPVLARSAEERDLLTSLPSMRNVLALVEQADVDLRRRRLDRRECAAAEGRLHQLRRERGAAQGAGAVGEITGWAFDARGPTDRGTDQRTRRQRAAAPADQAADDRRRDGPVAPRRAARRACRPADFRPDDRRGDGRAFAAALSEARDRHRHQDSDLRCA